MKSRTVLRIAISILYVTAGAAHLLMPGPFLRIMPAWVPAPEEAVFWTGVAEIAGGAALLQPWNRTLRKAGAAGLALYAICVFPANLEHMAQDLARPGAGLGLWYHAPRLALQPFIVWLALWAGGVTDWPVKRRRTR